MSEIYVAFLWHQHQPYYKDLLTGKFVLPWVRLHGIRDYIGMAQVVSRFPDIRVTINLVPSLLAQIEEYARGEAEDELLRLLKLPASELTKEEKEFVVSNAFSANLQTMIRPHPGYLELHHKCRAARASDKKLSTVYDEQELTDLEVWSILAWFHPLIADADPIVNGLISKDRDFTEEDKQALLHKQQEVLADIIPLHRKLQEDGQIEVSTSAFYHPILPLLCDPGVARRSNPEVRLPLDGQKLHEDARAQVESAVDHHSHTFGRPPRGFWPAEGAVSDEIMPMLAEAGIQWLASDEEILGKSLGVSFRRGDDDHLWQLYQPYAYQAGQNTLQIVFRDHYLSDLIGFQYQRMSARAAVDDLMGRLEHIKKIKSSRPPLVSIILDGENPWEHYDSGGVDFLEELYGRLSEASGLITTTLEGYLDRFPANQTLSELYPGSWINHNFDIWIGHEEDNRAWEYVYRTRDFLKGQEFSPSVPPEQMDKAWQEVYIAQGSDWFWWFGGDHSSPDDEVFDHLFRTHLRNVYTLARVDPPAYLDQPVSRTREKAIYDHPTALLNIKVDGQPSSYFEWLGAGRYHARQSRATMALATRTVVQEVFFGFDLDNLFLRLDPGEESDLEALASGGLRVVFREPTEQVVEFRQPGCEVAVLVRGSDMEKPFVGAEASLGSILEVRLPFPTLGISSGNQVSLYLEVDAAGLTQRIPQEGTLGFTAPSPDFEAEIWQV